MGAPTTTGKRLKYLPYGQYVHINGYEDLEGVDAYVVQRTPEGTYEVAVPEHRSIYLVEMTEIDLVEQLLWPPDRGFTGNCKSGRITDGNLKYMMMIQKRA